MAVFLIGVAYAVTLAAGLASHGLSEPIGDPILAIMEVLTLVSAVPILILVGAIHGCAPADRKTYALIALAFAILFAGTTSAVHFMELTAVRQMGAGGIVWPSRVYAVELLAWDVFLGLSLLFAALVFGPRGSGRAVRRGLLITGVLCLAGTVGPAAGNMRLQLIGVLGYAAGLPIVCFMLAGLFRSAPGRRLISSGSSFEREIGYSRAVVQGNWVFVSGTTGFDYSSMTIPDDLRKQTEQCLRNIQQALREAGASLDDVVRVKYLLPNAQDFPQCWPILRKYFGEVRPAATMLSAGLADPRMKIEIEVTAYRTASDR